MYKHALVADLFYFILKAQARVPLNTQNVGRQALHLKADRDSGGVSAMATSSP